MDLQIFISFATAIVQTFGTFNRCYTPVLSLSINAYTFKTISFRTSLLILVPCIVHIYNNGLVKASALIRIQKRAYFAHTTR